MSTPFIPNQEIIKLPCNHFFEPLAIKKWLQEEKAECPVCRYNDFKTKEIKIEEEEQQPNNTAELNRLLELFIRYQDYSEYNNFIQTVRTRDNI